MPAPPSPAVRIIKHEALPKTGSYEAATAQRPSIGVFLLGDIGQPPAAAGMLTGNQRSSSQRLARRAED